MNFSTGMADAEGFQSTVAAAENPDAHGTSSRI